MNLKESEGIMRGSEGVSGESKAISEGSGRNLGGIGGNLHGIWRKSWKIQFFYFLVSVLFSKHVLFSYCPVILETLEI